jgi:hypothetical protein
VLWTLDLDLTVDFNHLSYSISDFNAGISDTLHGSPPASTARRFHGSECHGRYLPWPANSRIDQAEEMFAVGLQALQHLPHLVRRLAIDIIEDKLRIAEDGIERRPQLVAHVG